ncbi:hypothetical protein CJ179_34465 [Rhodococcus sp. ACS1]|uniref:Uncharacterized protein n=1 Tax=Rhodococcus jostii TaxID=132919 RepID=A0A1H5LTJ4_RHOJO|nr:MULTISPECIES: hypothetical protein [Rhodococcus]PBC39187.1 hypothetical protein CJ179_34465 [Rhodococcus sp. ACS1]SEE80372.1 hypothetical protein SAMN04490220_8406 [Rhodococcus jostii]
MASDKQARRETALLAWSRPAGALGFDVPTEDEIRRIAASQDAWRSESPSAAAVDWADTIVHILHQIKFGMDPLEVVRHLPDDLLIPASGPVRRQAPVTAPAPTPAPEPVPESEPVLTPIDALFAWRAQQIANGVEYAETIKDATFHNLIKYGHTSVEQVRRQLRGPATALAEEIAAILASFAEPVDEQPSSEKPASAAGSRPEPAVQVPPGETGTVGLLDQLVTADFCEYEYGETDVVPTGLKFTKTVDGYTLSWTPHASQTAVTLYRIVSGEGSVPHKPEAGDLVGVTLDTTWDDGRFFASAVRNLQIWCHAGADVDDARKRQPVLIAQGEIVSPVTDFVLTEDEGRVIGQWNVWSGTQAVRIHRIPLGAGSPVVHDPRNEICSGQPNLTGFVDREVERGARYLYRAMSEVVVNGGTRLSQPAQGEILVSVVLESVNDLTVQSEDVGDIPYFDLVWTDPSAGRVVIYRTESPPDAGLQDSDVPEASLDPQGLTDETRLAHPAVAGEGRTSRMVGVPWPSGWDRAYLTPVTLLNGTARVGATTVQTRPIAPVSNARIIERCNKQIVTFGWPKSAAAVLAYIGPMGLPFDQVSTSADADEISARQYRRDGGMSIRSTLPAGGCSVHLVPIAFSRGEQITGTVTSIEYNGLVRMAYGLRRDDNPGASSWVSIHLYCAEDVESPPPLVLVFNRDRLPLSSRDGNSVPLRGAGEDRPVMQCVLPRLSRGWADTGWKADVGGHAGYVRLFVDSNRAQFGARRFAMLDPAISTLRLEPGSRSSA